MDRDDAMTDDDGPSPSLMTIKRAVCSHFGIAMVDLLSVHRPRELVMARHVAMYLARKLTSRSLPEIGFYFGGRDHTTVLYAIRKIEQKINDPLSGVSRHVRNCAEACRPDLLPGTFPWRDVVHV